MKITHLIAAAAMIAGIGVSTAASAQDYRHGSRYEQRGERRYDHRGDRRDDRRAYRGNRGRQYGLNNRRACRTEWRHHRRVTVCYR